MRRELWHLSEGLIFVHFAVFVLGYSSPEGLRALALVPGEVVARPWSLVTFQFLHGTNMFWFFISMLVLWIMAKPLEDGWGSPRFLLFWLIATLGGSITATTLGIPLFGDLGVGGSILFTFATLYPETEFRLFFVIPVKVKYLAIVAGAFLAFSGLSFGLTAGVAYVAGMSAGYLFFLATRRLPTRRRLAFELGKRKATMALRVESAAAGQRNLAWDPLVRAAEARARELGRVADQDDALLAELDQARDPSVTVCAPEDFGFVDDGVCRSCPGFAECAARRIRMAAEESAAQGDRSESQ
jgi:membrane associated rhomboid family serine protease